MKKLRLFLINLAVCFLLPQLLLVGCSLIGLGIGALSDASVPEGGEVSIVVLRGTKVGTNIALTMRDSHRIEGDYLSIREENSDRYREQYVAALEEFGGAGHVPLPGDSVTFAYRDTPGSKEQGRFRGVDPSTMVLNESDRRVLVADLGVLETDSGVQVDLSVFRTLLHERKLPFLTKSIFMKVYGQMTEVPVIDLVRVEVVGGAQNGKWIGLAIGAVVDAVVTVLLVKSAEESCRENGCHSGRRDGG